MLLPFIALYCWAGILLSLALTIGESKDDGLGSKGVVLVSIVWPLATFVFLAYALFSNDLTE